MNLLLLLLLSLTTTAHSPPKDAILLSQIPSLTLRNGPSHLTTSRRLPPIPQLRCLSPPSICALIPPAYPLVMRCSNRGSSYGDQDIEWTCTATLPETVRLASTDVTCEGYGSAEDDYVLRGSCGVEYRLVLTGVGERMYPDVARGEDGDGVWGIVFLVVFVGVAGWIAWGACLAAGGGGRRQPGLGGGRRWGGGGGGGGGGFDPGFGDEPAYPPPPYSRRKQQYGTQQREEFRPGFWTGAATGAAAGYMASNLNRDRRGGEHNRARGSGWASSSSSSHSNARGYGTGTDHQSSGFGSTSRR